MDNHSDSWFVFGEDEDYLVGPFASKDDALEQAGWLWSERNRDLFPDFSDDTVYVGEADYYEPEVDVYEVIECLKQQCDADFDRAGWLDDVSRHEVDQLFLGLQDALDRWMDKTGHKPDHFSVINARAYRASRLAGGE